MRIVHTSDWHLGHTLHEVSREEEQRAFLNWLLDTIAARHADALLICGDIFDSANPPASAPIRQPASHPRRARARHLPALLCPATA